MTKTEIINLLCQKMNMPREQAKAAVGVVLTSIKEALAAGEKVYLKDFGQFTAKRRKAREAMNPQTHETVNVGEHSTVVFKPDSGLKRRLNKRLDSNTPTEK